MSVLNKCHFRVVYLAFWLIERFKTKWLQYNRRTAYFQLMCVEELESVRAPPTGRSTPWKVVNFDLELL